MRCTVRTACTARQRARDGSRCGGRLVRTAFFASALLLACGDSREPAALRTTSSPARTVAAGAQDRDAPTSPSSRADSDLRREGPDHGSTTACGDLSCERATQICLVKGPIGPEDVYACVPVPEGCEDDRTCVCVASSLCPESYYHCRDLDENVVYCESDAQ